MANNGSEQILVVDDDAMSRRLLVRSLAGAGFTCRESGNGLDALKSLHDQKQPVLRLRADVQRDDYAAIQKKMKGTVWSSGCKSWYQHADGRIDTLWPGYTWEYWLKTRRFKSTDYR